MSLPDASKSYKAQEPVNRKASAKTRQVLRWFYEAPNRPDKKVISGQTLHVFKTGSFYKEGDRARWNGSLNPDPYDRIREIHDRFGYWVGIAAAEYTNWTSNYIMDITVLPPATQTSRVDQRELDAAKPRTSQPARRSLIERCRIK